MHHAPSVLYPVGRSRFLGRLVPALWLLGVLAAAGQAWHVGGLTGPVLLTAGSALLAGALAWWSVRQTPQGALRWNGEAWHWLPETVGDTLGEEVAPLATPPQVHLDLQQVLLLSLAPAGGRRLWLWLEKAQSPARWDDLRRAVFAERQATPNPADAVWLEMSEKGLA